MFNSENHARNLPDVYKKSTDSNNYKILEIERQTGIGAKETLEEILNSLDLDNAKGKTLDLYGEMLGQQRGIATDEQYLLLIRTKIMRNLSNGSYPSILQSLCATFSCDPSQIYIEELESPCTVKLNSLPLTVINNAGITSAQASAIVKKLLPVGITLESFLFEGTFQFADTETEQSTDAGFCDVEGGTTGGYLGVSGGDEVEQLLPI
jgi:hypothetical protein